MSMCYMHNLILIEDHAWMIYFKKVILYQEDIQIILNKKLL